MITSRKGRLQPNNLHSRGVESCLTNVFGVFAAGGCLFFYFQIQATDYANESVFSPPIREEQAGHGRKLSLLLEFAERRDAPAEFPFCIVSTGARTRRLR